MKNLKSQNSKKSFRRAIDTAQYYSIGLVEEKNDHFKLVDSFVFKRVNQYKSEWRRTNSRDLARKLNLSKLVIK